MRPTTDVVRSVALAGALVVSCLVRPGGACAQPPNYGHDFVTVGAPGNRLPTPEEAPELHRLGVVTGRVNHRYRITRTEVNVTQWFEFVVAYAPYWEGSPSDPAFTSDWIWYRNGRYEIEQGAGNYSANMSWYNAARYANWLHNGKSPERWAFEDGAYDTSTFRTGPNGWPMDQLEHHPGAAFWIPTWGEWLKAGYYDPDRYGPGQEGYWRYPNGNDSPSISGYPSQGGETNAGIRDIFSGQFDVGSYPDVQSPWGLLDLSGGVREWTETADDPEYARDRVALGSWAGHPSFATSDRIDFYTGPSPTSAHQGLRLASLVPSPPGALVPASALVLQAWRRRRFRCGRCGSMRR